MERPYLSELCHADCKNSPKLRELGSCESGVGELAASSKLLEEHR